MSMFSSNPVSWFYILAPYIRAANYTNDPGARDRYVSALESRWQELSRGRTEAWVFTQARVAFPCQVLRNPQIVHTGLTVDGDYIVIDFDTRMVGTIEEIRAAHSPHPNLYDWELVNDISSMGYRVIEWTSMDTNMRNSIMPRRTHPLDGSTDQRAAATQPAPRKPVTPKRRSMKFRLDFYFSRQAHDKLVEKLTASNKLYLTQTIPIEGTEATWIKVSWNEE